MTWIGGCGGSLFESEHNLLILVCYYSCKIPSVIKTESQNQQFYSDIVECILKAFFKTECGLILGTSGTHPSTQLVRWNFISTPSTQSNQAAGWLAPSLSGEFICALALSWSPYPWPSLLASLQGRSSIVRIAAQEYASARPPGFEASALLHCLRERRRKKM